MTHNDDVQRQLDTIDSELEIRTGNRLAIFLYPPIFDYAPWPPAFMTEEGAWEAFYGRIIEHCFANRRLGTLANTLEAMGRCKHVQGAAYERALDRVRRWYHG